MPSIRKFFDALENGSFVGVAMAVEDDGRNALVVVTDGLRVALMH